jgi:acyl carrier protein
MEEETVRERVREYITTELIRDPDYPLGENEGLITEGLMDSFSLADFAVFVEREFDVYIPDPELTVENMNTLNMMVQRILKR